MNHEVISREELKKLLERAYYMGLARGYDYFEDKVTFEERIQANKDLTTPVKNEAIERLITTRQKTY